MTKVKSLLLISLSSLALTACAGSHNYDPNLSQEDQIAAAIRRAENASGYQPSMKTLEARYKKAPSSQIAATEYAYSLRHNNQIQQAEAVIKPFAISKDAAAATKNEYANILLAQGNTETAEKMAQDAIKTDPSYDRAYHTLGIALDMQAMHKESERAFRKGLELWEGDPTAIMNNLALNLAAQNFLDEATEILQKALTISPEKTEIRRNLRIVMALHQTNSIPTPTPAIKPEFKD
ncbi:MAG: tetratricopeptide repeat protein [Micavibrio sp.]|nr:tetratricopeptide repeat protein [Micavibrio sp.]